MPVEDRLEPSEYNSSLGIVKARDGAAADLQVVDANARRV